MCNGFNSQLVNALIESTDNLTRGHNFKLISIVHTTRSTLGVKTYIKKTKSTEKLKVNNTIQTIIIIIIIIIVYYAIKVA